MKKLLPLLIKLLGRLPLSFGRALGTVVGKCMHLSGGRSKQVTEKNLALCFPDMSTSDRELLVKESLQETARTALEAAQVWIKPHAWLEKKIVSVSNQSLVEKAVSSAKGVVFLAPHLGNWEVVGPWICQRWGMMAMYAPSKNPGLDQLMLESREKAGSKLVPASLKGVMALIKALKKGGTVGILPDQVPAESGGCFAPFFGQQALTMTLIHNLIKRSGCIAIMVYARRVDGGFNIVFEAPDPSIYSDQEPESVLALNRSIEKCVKDVPAQYQWEYKRFRKHPEGMSNPYK